MDDFTRSYIAAALWTTNDESDESGGVPLDDNYTANDLALSTLKKIIEDCKTFQEKAKDLISEESCLLKGYSPLQYAGHDFWLTRNEHGAGFWDGDWTEPQANALTELAKEFGDFDLIVGDDGLIYN